MRVKLTLFFLLFGIFITPGQAVSAAPRADVKDDKVTFSFPNTATFSATLSSNTNITSVTLEYGSDQQTCGEVIAKVFPQFTPAQTVQVKWTWDMHQSGSLPPGANLWWRWRYKDDTGQEFVSEQKNATWLDNAHKWQTITSGDLNVHWYDKDQAFAQSMLNAGLESLRRNKEQAGLVIDVSINIYVYNSYADMKEAILYEPSWLGGMAFPEYNIVIMGIASSNAAWDQNTVIHELTHVLIGHFTFSCIGTVPTWLNEGLAMFSEGKLDVTMQSQLDQAVQDNTLLTVRSLNGGFSELPDKANLSYSQSYSITKFLLDTYGQAKMTELLSALRDAKPIDDALLQVYGFDTDGMEDAWRQAIGAAPRVVSAQPTSQPTPTYVPTYVPISGAPLAVTPTPNAIPTSSFSGPTPVSSGPPLSLTILLACICLILLLVFGVFILGIFVRSGNVKRGNDNDKI